MTAPYELRHGVRLPLAVDGHDDPAGQVFADKERADRRGGDCCLSMESAAMKKARDDLAKEKEGRRLDRRVFEGIVREFMAIRDSRAGELILSGKTLAQAEADPFVRRMDEAMARGRKAIS